MQEKKTSGDTQHDKKQNEQNAEIDKNHVIVFLQSLIIFIDWLIVFVSGASWAFDCLGLLFRSGVFWGGDTFRDTFDR
jgi:hypothetical protein